MTATHTPDPPLSEVLDRILSRVAGTACRLWNNPSDRDDLIQEGLIRAVEAFHRFDGRPERLDGWLLLHAGYAMRDWIRRQFGRRGQRQKLRNARSLSDGCRRFELGHASNALEGVDVEDLLCHGGFTEREQQILRERVAGYTLSEIGNHLGVSASRICQIIKFIARRLTERQSVLALHRRLHVRQYPAAPVQADGRAES